MRLGFWVRVKNFKSTNFGKHDFSRHLQQQNVIHNPIRLSKSYLNQSNLFKILISRISRVLGFIASCAGRRTTCLTVFPTTKFKLSARRHKTFLHFLCLGAGFSLNLFNFEIMMAVIEFQSVCDGRSIHVLNSLCVEFKFIQHEI